MTEKPQFISVVGPTGSGKSALALRLIQDLASRGLKAEVINADAMQFYRGMDIGTAKLPLEERGGIEHHLLDWLDITQESTAANYQIKARAKIEELLAAGILPVVVGGSMLYIAALLNTFEFPGRDELLRADLEQELIDNGPNFMHEKLTKLDSSAASRIEPNNGRRIVRALEIVLITGEPFAASLPDQFVSYLPNLQVGLNSDRANLVERLATRVESMWQQGLVEEVAGLIEVGLRSSKTSSQAIGYAQALAQLDDKLSQQEAIDQTTQLTQRYARRQMSWFRRDPRINWFDYQNENLIQEIEALVFSELEV
jgi:tRNA dimethylallyltransferase